MLAQINLPTSAVGRGAVGAQADRLLIIRQGALDIAEVTPDRGAVHVGRGRFGIDADGGVVVGDGLAVIAARIPGVATVLVGRREVAAVQISKTAKAVGDA